MNPYISVVIPVYNEEKTLEELYRRLTKTLDQLGKNYEIILTNDGRVTDRLLSPNYSHEKEYVVKVEPNISDKFRINYNPSDFIDHFF